MVMAVEMLVRACFRVNFGIHPYLYAFVVEFAAVTNIQKVFMYLILFLKVDLLLILKNVKHINIHICNYIIRVINGYKLN